MNPSGPSSEGWRFAASAVEQRVLILATTGNDAVLTQRLLAEASVASEIVGTIPLLCEKVGDGCGTLLLAEETLTNGNVQQLLQTIARQPPWSDIPLVLITSGGETSQTRLRRLTTLAPVGNVTMLERPFRPVTLLSAIETAMRARNKQYQVRQLLADVQSSERRVQSILGSIKDGFVALDRRWRFTYVNQSFLQLIGPRYATQDDLVGHSLWEKFPELLGSDVEARYRQAMAEQTAMSFEIYYEPARTWLEQRVYPAPDTLSVYVRDITERRRQEEALAALTRKIAAQAQTFDTTLSNITDFAYILDRDGRFVYANKPLLDLWGLTFEQAMGRDFFELNYPQDLASRLQRQITQVFSSGEILRDETTYTDTKGQVGFYEYIFSPVFGPDGGVEVIAGSTRVITERKRQEVIGERRRLVLQLIAEDAPLNKVFESLARMVELEARLEVGVCILIHDRDDSEKDPETDAEWSAGRRLALGRGLTRDWSMPILSSQGRRLGLFVMFHAPDQTPGREDQRLIATAISTAAVAIERKLAEQAVRAREAQLRLVTDHASVFLVQCDHEHRYKFVNRAYAERFGQEPPAFIGRHVSEFLGERAYRLIRPHMQEVLAGRRVEFEREIPFAHIGPRWLHTVYMPEHDKDGAVAGFVGVINDVTVRKQTELELMHARDRAIEASRAKDDFLAALSHELRTPLNPVLLIASEAAGDTSLPEKVREDFDTIAKNATLEARLIDDLLDLTRITHGKMSLDKRVIDLHEVLADALETVASDLEEKRLVLSVKLTSGPHHVFGDPARVQQIFWNVLKNAVKFTPHDGSVSVETRYEEATGCCHVKIQDTGIGMTREEVGRVFDAFTQGSHAQGTGSHRFGGLGLGLAISRMLVQLHAGQIHASSEGKDQGSTFVISFPKAEPAAVAQSLARPAVAETDSRNSFGASRPRHRILVVEDHAATRVSLTRLLARRGYAIVCAATVAEALERAAEQVFDLVVSDIGLPDGNGYALMALLREKYALTGIALSGYGMEQDIVRGREAGFTAHLIKPVSVQALDRALQVWESTRQHPRS
jgi:PAS domain S-box-containing protein